MKLRNKKTGKILDLAEGIISDLDGGNLIMLKPFAGIEAHRYEYTSLAKLNEEWEDYEEPKDKYCWIDYDGEIVKDSVTPFDSDIDDMKAIGNYFETKEEAEKAVEKLKAWKRLKDKGFKFTKWNCTERVLNFQLPDTFFDSRDEYGECISEETAKDLDICFGGENE